MKKTTAGEWCHRCHHLLVRHQDTWKHHTRDDWSDNSAHFSTCCCVAAGTTCLPESERPAPPWQQPASLRLGLAPEASNFTQQVYRMQLAINELATAYLAGGTITGSLGSTPPEEPS